MSHRAAPEQTSAETRSVCRSGSGRGFRDVAQRLDLACSFLRIFLRQLCKSNNGLRKSNKVFHSLHQDAACRDSGRDVATPDVNSTGKSDAGSRGAIEAETQTAASVRPRSSSHARSSLLPPFPIISDNSLRDSSPSYVSREHIPVFPRGKVPAPSSLPLWSSEWKSKPLIHELEP